MMRNSRCDGTGDPAAHNNVSEGMGRMVVTQTPGGLYAQFIEKVGKAVHGEARPLY